MAQKFIIKKNGELVMGNVGYHFELFDNVSDRIRGCYGGGLFEIDDEAKVVRLSGTSSDFGDPKFDELVSVPSLYEDYTFVYKEQVVYPLPIKQEVEYKMPLVSTCQLNEKFVNRRERRARERAMAKQKKRNAKR